MHVDLSAKHVLISNEHTGNLIAVARVALTDQDRKTGLLNQDSLEHGMGLWITDCNRIHTFGMKFPIDVIFLDANYRLIAFYKEVGRSQHCACDRAASCIELPAGGIDLSGLLVGQHVLVTPLD
jgi:uncharacterized protein